MVLHLSYQNAVKKRSTALESDATAIERKRVERKTSMIMIKSGRRGRWFSLFR
jgi:hypothetical protein